MFKPITKNKQKWKQPVKWQTNLNQASNTIKYN